MESLDAKPSFLADDMSENNEKDTSDVTNEYDFSKGVVDQMMMPVPQADNMSKNCGKDMSAVTNANDFLKDLGIEQMVIPEAVDEKSVTEIAGSDIDAADYVEIYSPVVFEEVNVDNNDDEVWPFYSNASDVEQTNLDPSNANNPSIIDEYSLPDVTQRETAAKDSLMDFSTHATASDVNFLFDEDLEMSSSTESESSAQSVSPANARGVDNLVASTGIENFVKTRVSQEQQGSISDQVSNSFPEIEDVSDLITLPFCEEVESCDVSLSEFLTSDAVSHVQVDISSAQCDEVCDPCGTNVDLQAESKTLLPDKQITAFAQSYGVVAKLVPELYQSKPTDEDIVQQYLRIPDVSKTVADHQNDNVDKKASVFEVNKSSNMGISFCQEATNKPTHSDLQSNISNLDNSITNDTEKIIKSKEVLKPACSDVMNAAEIHDRFNGFGKDTRISDNANNLSENLLVSDTVTVSEDVTGDVTKPTIQTQPDQKIGSEQIEKPEVTNLNEPTRYYTRRDLQYQVPSASLGPLPDEWVELKHETGVPFYLCKSTNVVTWSRPYLPSCSSFHLKRHKVPTSSIPCLHYEKVKEAMTKEIDKQVISESGDHKPAADSGSQSKPDTLSIPSIVLHEEISKPLEREAFIKYLDRRFVFHSYEVPYYANLRTRRSGKQGFRMKREHEDYAAGNQRAVKANIVMPNDLDMKVTNVNDPFRNTSVGRIVTLTIPSHGSGKPAKRLSFNTAAKPVITILHEYLQQILKTKPDYVFTTEDSVTNPFFVRIFINGKEYGSGSGASKRVAKNKAALETMEILIPGIKAKIEGKDQSSDGVAELLDGLEVSDKRVYELCVHAGTFLPYEILNECIKRNQKIAAVQLHFEILGNTGRGGNVAEFVMTCGKHKITGTARNKKVAKQVAAQRMLKLLHPQAKTWGELTRLYGISVAERHKRKQDLEDEILELKERSNRGRRQPLLTNNESSEKTPSSSSPHQNEPPKDVLIANPELLAKLKSVMMSLGKERGLLGDERKKQENERENEEIKRKKRKLLLIDI